MARYIDADVAIEEISKDSCGINDYDDGLLTAIFELKTMPTADVVEVVRCKDCMHTEIDKYAPAECQNRCKLSQQYHEPTFFCKCGEPRTDLLEWIHRGDDDE